MGSPDPSAGRLALAPSEPPRPGPADREPGARPDRSDPPRPRATHARRRLVVVTVLLTIAVLAYLVITSLGASGGGDAGGAPAADAYQRANRAVATEAQAIVQAGTDLRALRDVDKFRAVADRSLAAIATQVTVLQQLGASRHGVARSTIDETVASAQRLALLGTAFERDVVKEQLGAANRDELSIHDEILNLQQQFTAWKR